MLGIFILILLLYLLYKCYTKGKCSNDCFAVTEPRPRARGVAGAVKDQFSRPGFSNTTHSKKGLALDQLLVDNL